MRGKDDDIGTNGIGGGVVGHHLIGEIIETHPNALEICFRSKLLHEPLKSRQGALQRVSVFVNDDRDKWIPADRFFLVKLL